MPHQDDSHYSIHPAPLEPRSGGESVYTPLRRAAFLSAMLAKLRASPMRLYSFGAGNIPHRFAAVFADELEKLSVSFGEIIRRAIDESTFRAWEDETFFPPRLEATLARGHLELWAPYPLASKEVIPAGSLFGSKDGRTLRSEAEAVIPAGQNHATVPVVSEVIGAAGNFLPGSVTLFLSGRASFIVNNPVAISGGRDAETYEERKVRFRDMVESRATASRLSLYSAAHNTFVADPVHPEVQERVVDAALILPWQIQGWNAEMSHGYLSVDTGGGRASAAFLEALQQKIDGIQAAGDVFEVVATNPFIVEPKIRVSAARTSTVDGIRHALNIAWENFAATARIEDGRGRGRLSLLDFQIALETAHPEIISVRIDSHSADFTPPIGARVVAGEMQSDIRLGEII